MKRRILLSCIALTCAVLGVVAQRGYTFNATALNVDGLPKEVLTFSINPDGKEEAGATELCGILANSGWDIVGFSEDFNFHEALTAAPASTYYNFGKHGGTVLSTSNSTDGLGIAVAKHLTFPGAGTTGTKVAWDEYYGGSGLTTIGDNGADNMITKGFRMYTVTIAEGVAVDVYVLHMDASTADSDDDWENGKDKNVAAREAQLTQLADYIIANHNGRPVIILGDTNCRYTREALKTGFIDVINADSRFTIEDAWVELMWGGAYPTYGGESMMTDTYGMQKGEIVDKVFYINTTESNLTLKANSYLHDESVTVSDHRPVVVNFTLTDPNGTAINKEDSWTLEEIEGSNSSWEGEQVKSGTTYYMMNVGTGEYIKWGGDRYTEAVAGNAGVTITPIQNGNTWALKSSDRNGGLYMGTGEYTYLDRPIGESTWTLEPIDGTEYQYRLKTTGGLYLSTTPSEVHKPIKAVAGNTNDDNQKWIFLTDDRIRTEMNKATAENPFNFTALLKSADFDAIEIEDGWANNWDGFDWSGGGTATLSGDGPFKGTITGWNQNNDHAAYSTYAYANTTSDVSMSQNLGTLPNGTYEISFEGFYRATYKKKSWNSTTEETVSANVVFGPAKSIAILQNTSTNIGDDAAAHLLFKNDTYATSSTFTMDASQGITFSVNMPKTTGYSRKSGWICVDNFSLKYFGTGEVVNYDPYKNFKNTVARKVNETYEKVLLLNDAGQAAYDISAVIYRHENDLITTEAIANSLCDVVDEAYANACEAHKNYIVSLALANMESNGGDITAAIINPSFETGDVFGWTIGSSGWDKGARLNSDATFTTEGCDGEYLFNSYAGEDGHTGNIQQTINGIPNGLYELKAKLTSFNIDEVAWHQNDADNPHSHTEHYRIYLTGNGYHTSIAADKGKTVFHETTLYFLVEDHSATIGAVGGNKGPNATEFKYYWPWEGCFFKADNFRLKRICDVPHGRLKLALNEAEAANLDAYGKAALDLSSYQTMFDNKSLATDGTTEAAAVYTALRTAAKAQKTAGADMTWAIENPSFETGDYTGWSITEGWDSGVREQQNGTYSVAGTDGRYMYNVWINAVGYPITQTVTGIPNGTYKLTAMVATDADKSITLTGNDASTTIAGSTNGGSSGVFPEVECTVTDGTLDITVEGVNNVWYKCDDFHLTLLSPSVLVMNETDKVIAQINDTYSKVTVNRTIKPNTWSTFVVPFDIPTYMLGGWEIKELTKTEMKDNGDITLVFGDAADGIKAGVPYMVRNTTMTENLTSLSMENVLVNTTSMNNPTKGEVTFVGTYKSGYVPQGAFFISNNTFYQAADNTNTLKAFRAYFTVAAGTNARALKFRIDGEEGTTAIDELDSEVTVVGIYTLGGVRINEMQQGINILQMSDGSVVKVVIK